MFDALASLAQRRRLAIVLTAVVLFGAAGAVGASVADRLDPFGADDPDTESVIADERLEDAGYRGAGVVVLIEGVQLDQPAGLARVREIERELLADPEVAGVSGFLSTSSSDFLSREDDATYLAVALATTEDKAQQEAADGIRERLEGEAGVSVGGPALAQRQVNEQVEEDLRTAELLAFPLLFLLSFVFFRSLVAAALPLLVGGLAILGTFFALRIASDVSGSGIISILPFSQACEVLSPLP